MEVLNVQIRTAYEASRRKEKIIIHLKHLDKALKEARIQLKLYDKKLAKKSHSLDKRSRQSVRQLFHRILGTEDPLQQQEEQEYLSALLKQRGYKKNIELMEFEQQILKQQLNDFYQVEEQLQELLDEKKQLLLNRNTKHTAKLIAIEQRLIAQQSLKREIQQAKVAGKACLRILEKIEKQLREIFEWGTAQPGNKRKNKTRPRRWASRATQNAYKAKSRLQKFETELLDLSTHYDLPYQEQIATIHLFLNFFVDNLIVDWIIQKKINHTIYGVNSVHDRVSMILLLLENEITETQLQMRKIREERKQLLIKQ